MLFKNREYRYCAYCARAVDCGEEMLCRKKGVVAKESCCAAFRYDPLKRVPPQAANVDFSSYQDDDFKL